MKRHPWRKWRQASTPLDAPKQPTEAPGETERRKAGDRAIAAETARTVPSDAEIDRAQLITQRDIDSAVNAWDDAQSVEGTGLEGLLEAEVTE